MAVVVRDLASVGAVGLEITVLCTHRHILAQGLTDAIDVDGGRGDEDL